MVSYSVLIAFGVAISVTACRQTGVERAKQQSGSPALDTAASPRARPAASAPGDSIAIDSVRGCPFECCQYGRWRFETLVALHAAPRDQADSVGIIRAGVEVAADSGFVFLHPPGLAVITDPTVAASYLTSEVSFASGDSLELLDYLGEGHRNVRWHGRILDVSEAWDSTGRYGARLVREPVQTWWVHVTDERTGHRGWVLMEGVHADGSDACS